MRPSRRLEVGGRKFRGSAAVDSRVLAYLGMLLLGSSLVAANVIPFSLVDAQSVSQRSSDPAAATPVPLGNERADPLDGDPLDGEPRPNDDRDPEALAELEIVRSGRPANAPDSRPAYDGDPKTVWTVPGNSAAAWVWFDLGDEEPVREVRWLARGGGAIEVALSDDRDSWREVGRRDVRAAWQTVALAEEARYVRLTLRPDEDGNLPMLAEVAAYGTEGNKSVARKQRARDDEGDDARERERGARDRERDRAAERRTVVRDRGESEAESGPGVSAEPGETRCRGKRAKCEAREGRVSVEEDCDREGTCVIDIRADGGTAVCDASGPDEGEAGRGEGKRGGDGGRCEAVANGGTVTVGDINP
jgi:hypothetical protein